MVCIGKDKCSLIIIALVLLALTVSCRTSFKLSRLKTESAPAALNLGLQKDFVPSKIDSLPRNDTITVVDMDGRQLILMNAIKDDDGNMVANQVLDAAVVVARFRNVPERNGRVDLEFQVIVPQQLHDKDWQIRYQPYMYIMEDSLKLDRILITGEQYRRRQLRGYQQYQRFLDSIIGDTTRFIDSRALEIWIKRNIPKLYAFRTDSSFVDDQQFNSAFGVGEREAVDHYTDRFARHLNDRRIGRKDKKYRHYVKVPIETEGIRLDTVLHAVNGNYIYNYVQTIKTRPRLRKVDIVLDGQVYRQDEKIFDIPASEPLTFFISSISAFVDGTERYMTTVVERKANLNAAYNIEFATGSSDIRPELSNNTAEIGRIKAHLDQLLENLDFDLDSIAVTSSCSPEGSVSANRQLSHRRGESISAYFRNYIRHKEDSLARERGVVLNLDDSYVTEAEKRPQIRFLNRSMAENWPLLNMLVEADTVLTHTQKEEYYAYQDMKDADAREQAMKKEQWYDHVRMVLYPRLRSVQFRFHLSRKGMVKDTVHTTVLDTLYMSGVQAIRDRDYEKAAEILGPYADFNTAVAYLALDRNASAYNILCNCPRSAPADYMMAIIHARKGEDQKAVQYYLDACAKNGQYIHRGNLDPEISALIRKYNLNNDL